MIAPPAEMVAVDALYPGVVDYAERFDGLTRDHGFKHFAQGTPQVLAHRHFKSPLGAVQHLVGQVATVRINKDLLPQTASDLPA